MAQKIKVSDVQLTCVQERDISLCAAAAKTELQLRYQQWTWLISGLIQIWHKISAVDLADIRTDPDLAQDISSGPG